MKLRQVAKVLWHYDRIRAGLPPAPYPRTRSDYASLAAKVKVSINESADVL